MAEVSFHIHYFLKADGRGESELGAEFLQEITQKCGEAIELRFSDVSFEPSLVDLVMVDTWSEIPPVFRAQGFDAFCGIYISFDVDDELVEGLGLDGELEEYVDDIDLILGSGIYNVKSPLPITRPVSLQIFV